MNNEVHFSNSGINSYQTYENQPSQSKSLNSNFNPPSFHFSQVQIRNTYGIPSDSGSGQANGPTNENILQYLSSEKTSKDSNPDIHALDNNQANGQINENILKDLSSEKKLGEMSLDTKKEISKALDYEENKEDKENNQNVNNNSLKNSNPMNKPEPEQASCFNSIDDVNQKLLQTLDASQSNNPAETAQINQFRENSQEKNSILDERSPLVVETVVEILRILDGVILRQNQPDENQVHSTFERMPNQFSNDAQNTRRRELERLLETRYSEIARRTREEQEEQKLSEKIVLTESDLASVLPGYKLLRKIGRGAHGVVYLVENAEGETKAVKTYPKCYEREYTREAGILSRMDVNDTGGQVGITKIFETEDLYGVVLAAGNGTVLDYKEFLKRESISLSENQLISIFKQIFHNIGNYMNVGFVHRDLKPTNIIVSISSEGLEFQIIDYSIAICLSSESKKILRAGTPGYIDPYLLENWNNLTTSDFALGDLFSLGITLLELAVPSFIPKENDWECIDEALSKLVNSQPNIFRLLSLLLSEDKYRTEGGLKQFVADKLELFISDFEEKSLSESELVLHCERFQDYLASKTQKGNDQKEIPLGNDVKDDEDDERQRHLKAIHFIREDNSPDKPLILNLTSAGKALAYFIKKDDTLNQMLCYENLLKYYIQREHLIAIKHYSNLLWKLAGKLEEAQLRQFPEPYFLFSTLGVAYYQLSMMEKSCELFRKGLKIVDNEGDKICLLNNLANALSLGEGKQKEASEMFQEAYWRTEEFFESFCSSALIFWSEEEGSDVRLKELVCVWNDKPIRSFEFILLAEKSIPEQWKDPLDDAFYFYFMVFQSFCFDKARNMMSALLESEQNENLLDDLIRTSFSFNVQNSVAIRFDFSLELLLNLFKLATIFKEIKLDAEKNEILTEIKRESSDFLERKEELIQSCEDNSFQSFIEELKKSELLFLMVGFANIFRGSEEQDVKKTLENITKSFKIYLSKHEINLKMNKFSFKYGRGFTRRFQEKGKVKFEDINNSARKLHEEGKISMSLSLDKLPQFFCLESCEYKLAFPVDASCSKLTLSALDLGYKRGFSSGFDDLESLSLEIRDIDGVETASSISQDLIPLKKLRKLEFYFTLLQDFNGHSFKPLAETLPSLTSLQELKILFGWADECQFTMQYLEEAIAQLPQLKSLCLIFGYHADLTDKLISALTETLCNLEGLQGVFLQFCACPSISITATRKIEEKLKSRKKEVSVVIEPMWLY